LKNDGGKFVVLSGAKRFEADRVIIAMASYQEPKVPEFAEALEPGITQFHSGLYKKPDQLQEGDVLLVGAGNSASEIAMELSRTHKIYLSGRDTGAVPFRINTFVANYLLLPLVLKFLFHRVFTIDTFIGRNIRKTALTTGGPLIRVKPGDLKKAGVARVPRTVGIKDGKPLLEGGKTLDVKNVIWCTGFHPGFSWIDIPVMGEHEPKHRAGIVESVPGLYFTGLHFLFALSSTMVQGVGRDAKRIVNHITDQMKLQSRA
jgi:putative flavoprotein involved in K+ transport